MRMVVWVSSGRRDGEGQGRTLLYPLFVFVNDIRFYWLTWRSRSEIGCIGIRIQRSVALLQVGGMLMKGGEGVTNEGEGKCRWDRNH